MCYLLCGHYEICDELDNINAAIITLSLAVVQYCLLNVAMHCVQEIIATATSYRLYITIYRYITARPLQYSEDSCVS